MDKQKIEELSYKELQAKCAELDLGGKGSTEELQNKLKDYYNEETPEEEPKEEKKEEAKGTIANVLDKYGRIKRTYTRETHGASFIKKANQYVETRPNKILEVEVR